MAGDLTDLPLPDSDRFDPIPTESPDGRVGHIAGYSHSLGDYLRAALPHGPGPPDIRELHPWVRDAANAPKAGLAAVVAWDLELRPDV